MRMSLDIPLRETKIDNMFYVLITMLVSRKSNQ